MTGVPPSGPGSRVSHEAAKASSPEASIPNAGDGDSYRMNPHFRRFLGVVGSVERAMVAWDIAADAFFPCTPEADFEVWQDDQMVAGCSGPRERSLAEAIHYAVVYQTDDHPCVIQEVGRREISPNVAHSFLASAMSAGTAETEGLRAKPASAIPKGDAP